MRETRELTEHELDKILLSIPSSCDRAALMSHLSIVRGWKKPSRDESSIVGWIRKTWPGATVRAKMAQKVANLIEQGEHRSP